MIYLSPYLQFSVFLVLFHGHFVEFFPPHLSCPLKILFNFCMAANDEIPLSMWKSTLFLRGYIMLLLCCVSSLDFIIKRTFTHALSLTHILIPLIWYWSWICLRGKCLKICLNSLTALICCLKLPFIVSTTISNEEKKKSFMFYLLTLTIPTSERMPLILAVNATHENEKQCSVDHWLGAIFIFRHEWREITPKWIHLGIPHASMLYQQTCYYSMLPWTQLAIQISVLSLKFEKYKVLKMLMDSIAFYVSNNFNTGWMK